MRNIPNSDHLSPPAFTEEISRFDELLTAIGRRWSLRDPIATIIEELSITPPQLHAIMWLGKEERLTMGHLAQRIGVTEKTVTGLVDRLERDGFVIRERDDADRRIVRATLTDRGLQTFNELSRRFEDRLRAMLALIDQDDREALLRMMEKLATRIRAEGPPAT